ncbi:MAG: M48 family metallopeptidase [Boseongicola sp.]
MPRDVPHVPGTVKAFRTKTSILRGRCRDRKDEERKVNRRRDGQEGQSADVNTLSTNVNVRHSVRARRMTLRVSQLDGRATLTVPRGTSDRLASKFLRDNATWLDRARSRLPETVTVGAGTMLPIEGRMMRVQSGPVKVAKIYKDQIVAPESKTAIALQSALKGAARTQLETRVAFHADAIGRNAAKLTIRDPRSRWGSCSAAGNLMFSWRLIMAPPEILDYVAAHEVAHLQEMNHSLAYWNIVQRLFPNYKSARRWLRSEGNQLHRYRFD